MFILGISCFYHDSASALVKDGKLVAAAEEERFSRIKHDIAFPQKAISFCLDEAKIKPHDLDYVVFYEKPFRKFDRTLLTSFQTYPKSWRMFGEAMISWFGRKLWIKDTIKERVGIPADRILFVDHHLSHAASSYYCSPFEEAAVLTLDGVGEWTTACRGVARANELRLYEEIRFPHSLGLLYSAFTAFLGFKVNDGEYKVMGMAPYGQPKYVDLIKERLVDIANDGSFRLNLDYFSHHYSDETAFNSRFVGLFGPPRSPSMPFITSKTGFAGCVKGAVSDQEQCLKNEHYADIAASIQSVTEEIILKLAIDLHRSTGIKNLCLAGGCALNSKANGRIFYDSPFDNIFVQPAAGDSGGALGAALYAYHDLLGKSRSFVLNHAYFGKGYSDSEVRTYLDGEGIKYDCYADETKLVEYFVDRLVDQKVIGLFQGRFEWGPRALGNRSILADPRSESMKDRVNLTIKYREPFRPFGPSVNEEFLKDLFVGLNIGQQYPSRFMQFVLLIREGWEDKIRSVNHFGTARVQSVNREWNSMYYKIIDTFRQATGVPAVLNTSFNLRGEPIVASIADALSTFYKSGLDMLVLNNCVIQKT